MEPVKMVAIGLVAGLTGCVVESKAEPPQTPYINENAPIDVKMVSHMFKGNDYHAKFLVTNNSKYYLRDLQLHFGVDDHKWGRGCAIEDVMFLKPGESTDLAWPEAVITDMNPAVVYDWHVTLYYIVVMLPEDETTGEQRSSPMNPKKVELTVHHDKNFVPEFALKEATNVQETKTVKGKKKKVNRDDADQDPVADF